MVNEGVKTVKQSLTANENVVRVQANEYFKKGQSNLIREAMIKGYVEMSHINLSICTECLHAEYEAQHTTERLVSGG
nr:transcriptional regulator [Psychrobacillus vulpis]